MTFQMILNPEESLVKIIILKKGKRAPFSSWAGKRSGEMPIYHEVPEYARWRDLFIQLMIDISNVCQHNIIYIIYI